MIGVHDLEKYYGKQQVLKGVNATFMPGQIYGVVGGNGAGKTTFFRCLAGLEKYKGKIEAGTIRMKEQMSYLPAELYFLPKITGEEFLRLMLESRCRKVGDLKKQNIFDLPLDKAVSGYSTGMRKKLAILGVLLQESSVYLLDEPYNGLDFQSSLVLTAIIKRLKDRNKIVILSSHIFGSLEETCDSIILLQEGRFTVRAEKENFAQMKEYITEELLHKDIDSIFGDD